MRADIAEAIERLRDTGSYYGDGSDPQKILTAKERYEDDVDLLTAYLATLEAETVELEQRIADWKAGDKVMTNLLIAANRQTKDAERETIERCARVADDVLGDYCRRADAAVSPDDSDYYNGQANAASHIATKIRALPREAAPEGPPALETT